MELDYYIRKMRRAGVTFEDGLSEEEIERIQVMYDFVFPQDLKSFLQFALPVSNGFWNWRSEDQSKIEEMFRWPIEGICFDIENNDFWLDEWGGKPQKTKDQLEIAKKHVSLAPTLIPVCGHRFMPSQPSESGNPVFSVYQTDIIYYGRDLKDYLQNEFSYAFGRADYELEGDIKEIEFWSKLVE